MDDSRVEGRVVIEKGARLERATVRGPAIIGAGTHIKDVPTSVPTRRWATRFIERAELEHSIVLSGSRIADLEFRIEAVHRPQRHHLPRACATEGLPLRGGDNADVQIL